MTGLRTIIVAAVALTTAAQVVRSGFVEAYGEVAPARAANVWPGHPLVRLKLGLDGIGSAVASGKSVSREQIASLEEAARAAPLRPEPFLVRGVDAQLADDSRLAGRAFAEAVHRDPRSIAARYFMADQQLRSGNSEGGLRQIAMLARLVPSSAFNVATMLATYARQPGTAAEVKTVLRGHPELEPVILNTLAADGRNADLIIYLSNGAVGDAAMVRGWQSTLVNSLVTAGDYSRAHRVWARLSDVGGSTDLLFNPSFTDTQAPPPFNWALGSNASGLAEPENGGLHILYYGRENAPLASQLLMLDPGAYRLSFDIAVGEGDAAALSWSMTCLPDNHPILTVNLGQAAHRRGAAEQFIVPTGCRAQQLELKGTAPEFPETAEVSLTRLAIARGAGR